MRCRQDFYALDLGSLLKYYQPPTHEQLPPNCAWYLQHPQQLLPPNAFVRNLLSGVLDWSRYQDDEGFLGFACNLIHLNTGLLGLRFHVPGQIGECCCLFHAAHLLQHIASGVCYGCSTCMALHVSAS